MFIVDKYLNICVGGWVYCGNMKISSEDKRRVE